MQIFVGAGKREYVPLEERSVVEGQKKNPSLTIHSGYVWGLQTDIVTDFHLSHCVHGNNFFPSYSRLMSYYAGSQREQCWRHTRINHRQSCSMDSIL